MDRRQFLKSGLGWAAAMGSGLLLPMALSAPAQAADLGFDLSVGSRTLDLYRPATRERLTFEYMRNGQWSDGAYNKICWLLRDTKAHQYVQMDVRLIAVLDWTQRYLAQYGYNEPLHILSGYRTQETNAHTEGAARDSQHMYGRAADIRVPGLSPEYLAKLYLWLAQGGVGMYHNDAFVHVDTGPRLTPSGKLRAWRK